MNNIKVLISGASGFIGFPLVEQLAAVGCNVLALSRTDPGIVDVDSITWFKADISNPSSYQEKIESFQPEVVIHLAWQDIPDYSFEKSVENLNNSLEFNKASSVW